MRRYLVLAIALHVGIMLALAALPKPAPMAEALPTELYDVAEVTDTHDPTPPPPPPPDPAEPGAQAAPTRNNVVASAAAEAHPSGMVNGAARSSAGEVLTAQPTTAAPDQSGWSFSSTGGASASAIGLDGKNVIIGKGLVPPAASGEPSGGEEAPIDPAKRMVAIMKADLRAADVAKGLGAGGPVISTLESAVRRSMIPDESKARFVVDTDAAGSVISVRTSGGQGDESAWNALCADVKASLATRKFIVPAGANGLRIMVDLDSHMAHPSGNTSAAKLGRGGIEGDLSDIGASVHRVIHVRETSEITL